MNKIARISRPSPYNDGVILRNDRPAKIDRYINRLLSHLHQKGWAIQDCHLVDCKQWHIEKDDIRYILVCEDVSKRTSNHLMSMLLPEDFVIQ